MKRITFLFVTTALLLTGCVKKIVENTRNNPATDFHLRLNRTDAGGNQSIQVENALNLPGAAHFNAAYFAKQSSVHLQIGGIQVTTVQPSLAVNIHFNTTTLPSAVAGTYHFPADNDKVEFKLTENVGNSTSFRSFPSAGTLVVTYNEQAKTMSGFIDNLQYNRQSNSPYVSEVLSGNFKNVSAGQ